MNTPHDIVNALPCPAKRRLALHVTRAAEGVVRSGHPWLFDRAIQQQSHAGGPGDLAVIFDRRDRFLAIGLYDPHSPIRVRILHRGDPLPIDAEWFAAQLRRAVDVRAPLVQMQINGYRLVHGENDGLPGLVVDRYAATLVIKLYTAAWVPHLRHVMEPLLREQEPARVVLRLSRAVQAQTPDLHGLRDGMILYGALLDSPVLFCENGLHFEADPVQGQKTGFFLDQRENRARVEQLARDKSVLNIFAYTGGFSLYAARGGARRVLSLDRSRPALAGAQRNFAHNQHLASVASASHRTLAGDAFALLNELGTTRQRFDLVVIDPPAFAKRQDEIDGALSAYARLTRLGLGVLAQNGILVQASCSSRIDAQTFCAMVLRTARAAGRPLQEIERTGHPLDHPIGFPEGAYLKCLFARTSHG